MRAVDFPANISTAANARDPVGLNRRLYRDLRDSLEGRTSQLGTFDLMNKGITILALDVEEQHVEVYIRTGIEDDVITDIARGMNSAIQVRSKIHLQH